MINKDNLIAWSQFLYELEDAKDHLAALISDIQSDSDYREEELRVDLGHIFDHLNRAWNSRNNDVGVHNQKWEAMSKFPTDIEPVG